MYKRFFADIPSYPSPIKIEDFLKELFHKISLWSFCGLGLLNKAKENPRRIFKRKSNPVNWFFIWSCIISFKRKSTKEYLKENPQKNIWMKIRLRIFERKFAKEYLKGNMRKNIRKKIREKIFERKSAKKYSKENPRKNIRKKIRESKSTKNIWAKISLERK